MPGIVYVGYAGIPDALLGKFGQPIAIAAGGAIPPGTYWGGAWSANINGTVTTMPAGTIQSDGQATLTAAGNIVPLGAGMQIVWPWPNPWPIGH